MNQLGNEEKAALLLPSVDDETHELAQSPSTSEQNHNNIIIRRPRTYQRKNRSSATIQPILGFIIILCAFIFGCLTGVIILLYRISQDVEQHSISLNNLTKVDLTVQTKILESIEKTKFLNLNRTIESETDAASKLESYWQSLSNIFTRVNKLSYDLTLSTYAPSTQWSGIEITDRKTNQEIEKFTGLNNNQYLSFSSLIKSGKFSINYVYFVNYGRQEDFAYLIKRNQIKFEQNNEAIVFMRRKSTVISQTEQIRQAIYYGFAGIVLFDDNNEQYQQINSTDEQQSFSEEWKRLSTEKERQNFLDGISTNDDHQISVLILSYSDVEKLFKLVEFDRNSRLPCPTQWYNNSTPLTLGGFLQLNKLQLTTHMEEVPVHLPLVLGYIRGSIDADHFIMIGYQLDRKQQAKIIEEIIQAFGGQIKNGWRPRRSIVFCAWSGFSFDQYTIRRWITDNYRTIDRNLIAYIDLGNGIIANSTLNLRGSPLLQQVVQRAADTIVSPLVHNHTCHHRRKTTTESESHSHPHRRKRHEDHESPTDTSQTEEETECIPHKLFDEWIRASNNRIGINKTLGIVQMIDVDSTAGLFQLRYGVPSIIIEMTDEQELTNDTFYLKKSAPIFSNDIEPEVAVAYAQFVSEIIRQLTDEPLIPFNLTDYANLIDKQTNDYLAHYNKEYQLLASFLGDSSELAKLINELTKKFRQIQSTIDNTTKNNYINIQLFNEKLIQFERLFISQDQSTHRLNPMDFTSKHVLFGSFFSQTNTVVPFSSLSNLLFGITQDLQSELRDASQLYWSRLKQHLSSILRTLNGFDGLLSNS